jgi:hypothetical protein
MELAIRIFVPAVSIIITCVIPFVYVLCTGKFYRGILLTWGSMVLSSAILSIPVYELVWRYNPELTKFLPEGNSIIGALCMGWLGGVIISILALLARLIKMKLCYQGEENE